jgi:hypothetical protein
MGEGILLQSLMARKHEPLEVVDSSGLTDDDWAKINRLRHLHESGGSKALAFDELAKADPIKHSAATR